MKIRCATTCKKLKDLKQGQWFTMRPLEEPKPTQVWVRGYYVKVLNKYEVYNFKTDRERFIKGDTLVYTEFYFDL